MQGWIERVALITAVALSPVVAGEEEELRSEREAFCLLPRAPVAVEPRTLLDRRPGILTHRQNAAGRDIRIFQKIIGDEFVV